MGDCLQNENWASQPWIAHAKLKKSLILLGNLYVPLRVLRAGMSLGHPVSADMTEQGRWAEKVTNPEGQAGTEA